jgi:hypothetical protein
MTETEPKNRRLGYARVSTYGQTLDAQLAQLRKDGCAKIYREKASGAQPTRRELLKLLKHIAKGDEVTVTRIDRLARSTTRPHPHSHGGRPQSRQGTRPAYGPLSEALARSAERSTAAASRRRYAQGTRQELQCRAGDDFEAVSIKASALISLWP